jgi:hypothetical protein
MWRTGIGCASIASKVLYERVDNLEAAEHLYVRLILSIEKRCSGSSSNRGDATQTNRADTPRRPHKRAGRLGDPLCPSCKYQ